LLRCILSQYFFYFDELNRDDLYNQREIVHGDVRFEQQCILYNIGALHSYLGCLDNRNNDDVSLKSLFYLIVITDLINILYFTICFDQIVYLFVCFFFALKKGIRISCTHFQFAAWGFQSVRDTYSAHGFTSDLCEDVMTLKTNIMLVSLAIRMAV
jgi:tyrosine-protein phosphatase non-receptor type 23